MITISYDPNAGATFVWIGPQDVRASSTRKVSPGVTLDYDAAGKTIGIEILNFHGRSTQSLLSNSPK